MPRLAPAALAAVLLLTLAGCGGDAPSKAEYAEQAEEICKDTERQLNEAYEGADSPDEIADAVDGVIDETRGSLAELRDLEVPDGDAGDTAERFMDALEGEIEENGIPALEDLRDAIQGGDERAAKRAAEELQEIESAESDRLARELGAVDCVE